MARNARRNSGRGWMRRSRGTTFSCRDRDDERWMTGFGWADGPRSLRCDAERMADFARSAFSKRLTCGTATA